MRLHRMWWFPVALCGAACSGSDARSSPIDAGSPLSDGGSIIDGRIEDRTPQLDLDAIWRWDASPTDPGDEPTPPPEPCDPDAGTDEPPDTNDDVYGLDGCRPAPSRLIVLGDSIAEGFSESFLVDSRLREWAPGVAFERYSFSGSRIVDLPGQAQRAAPGPGHVFVFIWSIGNDFSAGIQDANTDLTSRHAAFAEVFAYFGDQTRFPGGATFLLNTQYGTRDECVGGRPAPGGEIIERLRYLNKIFFLDVAEARTDTVAIDHYPDFLGHTMNANVQGCPYCGPDNTRWTDILGLHPNGVGIKHVGEKWAVAFARMLSGSCPR
jgi:hypothetical protein